MLDIKHKQSYIVGCLWPEELFQKFCSPESNLNVTQLRGYYQRSLYMYVSDLQGSGFLWNMHWCEEVNRTLQLTTDTKGTLDIKDRTCLQSWHTSLQTTNWPSLCSALMASKQWYLQYNTASSKSSLVKWLATKYPCQDETMTQCTSQHEMTWHYVIHTTWHNMM